MEKEIEGWHFTKLSVKDIEQQMPNALLLAARMEEGTFTIRDSTDARQVMLARSCLGGFMAMIEEYAGSIPELPERNDVIEGYINEWINMFDAALREYGVQPLGGQLIEKPDDADA